MFRFNKRSFFKIAIGVITLALSPSNVFAVSTDLSDFNYIIPSLQANVAEQQNVLPNLINKGSRVARNIYTSTKNTSKKIYAGFDKIALDLHEASQDVSQTVHGGVASVSSALDSVRCFVNPIFSIFVSTPDKCKTTTSENKVVGVPVEIIPKNIVNVAATTTAAPVVVPAKNVSSQNPVKISIQNPKPLILSFVTQQEFQSQIATLNDAIKNLSTANTTVYVGGGSSYSVSPPDTASRGYVENQVSSVSSSMTTQINNLQSSLISWITGSSSELYYTSGNVGIGTTTPGSVLTVVGAGLFTGNVTANAFYGDGSNLTGITSFSTTTTRNVFSSSATGLSYATSTGIFSLTSGYSIPLVASSTEWATAYASTTALSPTYLRSLFSNTVTGLTYSNGVTSLTSGYGIPLTASTTNWSDFYTTPSTRITAGTGLSWSGNTLNTTGSFGNSAFTFGSGLIYNATSTDLVGVGTTTPTTSLFVQGKAGTNPFAIASSTGTQLLTVTQAGYVGIGTSTPTSLLQLVGTSTNQFSIGYDTSNYATMGVSSTAGTNLLFTGTAPNLSINFNPTLTSLIPTMTSNTAPSGIASASYNGYAPAYLAFNNDTTSGGGWESNGGNTTGWLSYEFPIAVTVGQYKIYPRTDQPQRNPKNWTFEGWDGSAWVLLDTQTNQTSWTSGVGNSYSFVNTVAYIKYRLNVSASLPGADMLSFSELRMYGLQTPFTNIAGGALAVGDSAPGSKLSVVGNAQIGYSSGQTAPANGLIVSGNVGIGTTTPGSALTVAGNIYATGTLSVASSTFTNFTLGSIPFFGTGGVLAQSNSNLFWDGTNSRLGIGTTTPAYKLSVGGDIALTGGLFANGTFGTTGMLLQSTGTGLNWVATSTLGISGGSGNSAFTFGSGLIYNATSTDLVGVGTTTPTTSLFVQGKAGTNPFAIASSTGTQLLTVTQAGYLGIGTNAPTVPLSVVGAASITGSLSAGSLRINDTTTSGLLKILGSSGNPASLTPTVGGIALNSAGPTSANSYFDGSNGYNGDTAWTGSFWVSYEFPSSTVVTGYKIYHRPDCCGDVRSVKTWTFEGWNGSAWVVLDTQTNITSWPLGSSQSFNFTNTTAYIKYRLNISAINSPTNLNLTELQMYSSTNYDLTAMYVGTGGNVGIGTSTPTGTLSVQGIAGSSNILTIASSTGTSLLTVSPGGNLSMSGTATFASSTFTNFTAGSIPFFGTGGVLAQSNSNLFWDGTNSRLGIGTTSPSAKLAITGSAGSSPFLVASSTNARLFEINQSGAIGLNNSFGTAGYVLLSQGSNAVPTWVATSTLGISGNSAFTFGSGLIYNATSTDLVGVGTTTPSTTLFVQGKAGTNPFAIASSTGTQLLTVTQAGYVGIGTTTPSQSLVVGSNNQFTVSSAGVLNTTSATIGDLSIPAVIIVGSITPNLTGTYVVGGTYNGKNYYVNQGVNGGYIWFLSSPCCYWILSPSLGVQNTNFFSGGSGGDTTPPATALWSAQNGGSGSPASTYGIGGSYANVDSTGNITTGGTLSVSSPLASSFTGKLGIGTTTPSAKLDLYGTAGSSDIFAISSSTNVRLFTVTSAGNVGIGTTDPSRAKLVVIGSVSYDNGSYGYLNSSGSVGTGGSAIPTSIYADNRIIASEFNANSDQRIKTDVQTYKNALATINSLNIVAYNKLTKDGPAMGEIGVLGQQLDSVFPLAVRTGKGDVPDGFGGWREVNDFHTVNYQTISMLGVQALQEQGAMLFGTSSGSIDSTKLIFPEGIAPALVTLASTTASTVDSSGNKTFLGKFLDRIIAWFADVGNGIGDFFANRVRTKTLCIGDEVGGETCINKTQLDQILLNQTVDTSTGVDNTGDTGGGTNATSTVVEINIGTTTIPVPESESVPSPEVETVPEPEVDSTPEPEPIPITESLPEIVPESAPESPPAPADTGATPAN
jgi:hypothetical protein